MTLKTEEQIIYIAVPLETVIDNTIKVKTEAAQRLEQDKYNLYINSDLGQSRTGDQQSNEAT